MRWNFDLLRSGEYIGWSASRGLQCGVMDTTIGGKKLWVGGMEYWRVRDYGGIRSTRMTQIKWITADLFIGGLFGSNINELFF